MEQNPRRGEHSRPRPPSGDGEVGVEYLISKGFGWSNIALMLQESPHAGREWRNGAPIPAEQQSRVRVIAEWCNNAEKCYGINDVAGWLETPLSPDAPITGLHLIEKNRFDILTDLASGASTPEQALNRFDPGHKTKYATPAEVFTAPDGLRSLRLAEEV